MAIGSVCAGTGPEIPTMTMSRCLGVREATVVLRTFRNDICIMGI